MKDIGITKPKGCNHPNMPAKPVKAGGPKATNGGISESAGYSTIHPAESGPHAVTPND